jgi:hypothetical protein
MGGYASTRYSTKSASNYKLCASDVANEDAFSSSVSSACQSSIDNNDTCAQAAQLSGLYYSGELSLSTRPTGCFVDSDDGYAYFNSGAHCIAVMHLRLRGSSFILLFDLGFHTGGNYRHICNYNSEYCLCNFVAEPSIRPTHLPTFDPSSKPTSKPSSVLVLPCF